MDKRLIDKITYFDRIVRKATEVLGVLLFAMLLLWLVFRLIARLDIVFTPSQNAALVYKNSALILLALFFGGVVLRLCLSPFVKSDEEEDFEVKAGYFLQKQAELKKKEHHNTPLFSPLTNLTEEQETAVCDVLRNLPSHIDKTDYINMAIMAQYLVALNNLGYLDITDHSNLRRWVERTTGKEVPGISPFNEALSDANVKKVHLAETTIKKKLESVR